MILVISANPLFKEILCETVANKEVSYLELDPDEALTKISEYKPAVIILDESIQPHIFDAILSKVRGLLKTRTIVLNPNQNEIVLLDSSRAILRKVDDLMDAIISQNQDIGKELVESEMTEYAEDANLLSGIASFMASMFNQRPDIHMVHRLRTIGIEALVPLDENEGISNDISRGIKLISNYLDHTTQMSSEQIEEELAVDWTRLFRGIGPNHGPPPPYESLYTGIQVDQIDLFQKLAIEYSNGDIEITHSYADRLDYIGLEFAFLSYLSEQEAAAWLGCDPEMASRFSKRVRQFYQQHLGHFAREFIAIAFDHAGTDFFKGFLYLSRGIMRQIFDEAYSEIVPEVKIDSIS